MAFGLNHELWEAWGTNGRRPSRAYDEGTVLQLPPAGASVEGLPKQETAGTCRGHGPRGGAGQGHEGRGDGKRIGRRGSDSPSTTMDLHTGARLASAGRSYSPSIVTSCLYNAHSNIPCPIPVRAAFTTSNIPAYPAPVSESSNRYHLLEEEETTPTGAVDPRIVQPTKRLASNSSRANASDEKSSTIMTPIVTASVE